MPVSHTATAEWQSFEVRMRRRRIHHCLDRATAALQAGAVDEAKEAIEEAADLDPSDETVRMLAAKITAIGLSNLVDPRRARRPPVAQPPQKPPPQKNVAVTSRESGQIFEALAARGQHPRKRLALAAALVLLSGAAGWFWTRTSLIVYSPRSAVAAITPDRTSTSAPRGDPDVPIQPPVISRDTQPALLTDAIDAHSKPEIVTGTSGYPAQSHTATPVSSDATTASTELKPSESIAEAVVQRSVPESLPLPIVAPPASRPDPSPFETPSGNGSSLRTPSKITLAPSLPDAAIDRRGSTSAPTGPSLETRLPAPVGETVAASAIAIPTMPATDQRAVEAILSGYETAYSRLDTQAVGAIWPSVDRPALARAFDGLASQTIRLGQCQVRVSGSSANAECLGTAQWTPKVGGGTWVAPRRWQFELKNSGTVWVIVSAVVR